MKVHLVCNPASGGSTDRDAISSLLEANGATLVDEDEAERIVVSGGDGTVAQGAELAARLDVPLAVIPTGTANDFARVNELPTNDVEGAELAINGEAGQPHELARMDGRAFVNVAAAGLAPSAAERAAPLKPTLGPLAYAVGAVVAGATDKPIDVRVDDHFDGEAWQVIVAASGAFGGGSGIDAADPHDGKLDLVVIPADSRIELARTAVSMRRGNLVDTPGVVHVRAADLTVHVPAGTPFNVDGEVVEAGPEVQFTVQERFRLVEKVR